MKIREAFSPLMAEAIPVLIKLAFKPISSGEVNRMVLEVKFR